MNRLAALALTVALFSGSAFAQSASPQDIIEALTMKANSLQQTIDGLYLQLAQYHAKTEADLKYLRENYVPKDAAKHD